MDNLSVVRGGDISVIFNHDNDMFNIQELSDSIGCNNVLSSIVKDPLNGSMYVVRDVSGQKWGDIVTGKQIGRAHV